MKAKGWFAKRTERMAKMREVLRSQRCCIFCASELKPTDLNRCEACKKRFREIDRKKIKPDRFCLVCNKVIETKCRQKYCGKPCRVKARGKTVKFREYRSKWEKHKSKSSIEEGKCGKCFKRYTKVGNHTCDLCLKRKYQRDEKKKRLVVPQ